MNQVHLYIKNLIALFFAVIISFLLINVLGPIWFPGLSVLSTKLLGYATGFLVLAFLNYRITGEKPSYLYGLEKSDEFLNKKGGFWLLFKWIFTLFGLVYDVVLWIFHGIYVLFLIILDFLVFFKMILFWIINAVLWFLKLFVPPLEFLYHSFIYYFIRWPWWIYKLTFRNITISVNRNFYFISFWGAVLSIFIILVFLGVGILMEYPVFVIIGAAFALLPVIWSYGEIAALRFEKREFDKYHYVRARFNKGYDSLKAVLFYFVLFLVFIILEIFFNLLSWIPVAGISFLGLSFNINTFISILLLFIFVIILFSKFMMPAHVVHDLKFETNLSGSIRFLGVIGQKILRYLAAHIPAAFFSAILVIIPALIIGAAAFLTLELKNSVIETRISILNERLSTEDETEKFEIQNQVDLMQYFLDFPQLVFDDFTGLKERIANKENLQQNLETAEKQLKEYGLNFELEIDSLQNLLNILKDEQDTAQQSNILYLESFLQKRRSDYGLWKARITMDIARLSSDLRFEKNMVTQLPVAFLFTIIWLSLFGGLVVAVIISYLGNIYYELYAFKEDGKPTFLREQAIKLTKNDRKQPLLGFTLLALVLFLVYAEWRLGLISRLFSVF